MQLILSWAEVVYDTSILDQTREKTSIPFELTWKSRIEYIVDTTIIKNIYFQELKLEFARSPNIAQSPNSLLLMYLILSFHSNTWIGTHINLHEWYRQ